MKIGIIGAGFTGLSAAFELSKKNHDVFIFEKDVKPGGLAIGYKEDVWKWSLEKHYHHWFTNDYSVLNLAKEIDFPVLIIRPKTSVYVKEKIYQLDSPISILKFPLLTITEKFKMSALLGFLKFFPFWKLLEGSNASKTLPKLMGKRAYQMIWEPLFVNKFGRFFQDVSLAWFWARIKKRTPSLAYPSGGFLNFADALVKNIKNKNGKFFFNTEIVEIKRTDKIYLKIKDSNGKIRTESFDKLIVTSPSFIFLNVTAQLPKEYKDSLGKLKGLGATNLVLRMSKPFFKDNTYWLSVCDKKAPVMAIVEHTNFMDKKNYNNEHILYLGNYREQTDNYFKMDEKQMLKFFDSYLMKINKNYKDNIIGYKLFKAPFAQPIIPVNYSKILPKFETPLEGVYLANIEQVYPWDRGTNYAVELGIKISKIILKDENS
jgi:protoporphyrinogen oxidase